MNVTIPPMTYVQIEAKARELFEKHKREIPVPVVAIANELGLEIYGVEMPEIAGGIPSGSLTDVDGKWAILLHKSEPLTRKRFTIAHEIGHFLLHKDHPFVDHFPAGETFYRSDEDNEIEREANYFAACLLMPAQQLKEIWPSCSDPADAAERFKVSEVSMTFRLKNLGLIQGVGQHGKK